MVLNIVTDGGFDFGIATDAGDQVLMAQLPADQLNQLSSSEFPDAIALLGGNDVFENDDIGRIVFGNTGNDSLVAGAGNDTIFGGQGEDTIIGGAGNDVLSGDIDFDTLTGGGGANEFIMQSSGDNRDWITDFTPGVDKLRLPDGIAFNDLELRDLNGDTQIVYNLEWLSILNGVDPSELTNNDFIGEIGEIDDSPDDPILGGGDEDMTSLQSATDLGTLTDSGLLIENFVNFEETTKYYRFTVPENGNYEISPVIRPRTEGLEGLSELYQSPDEDVVISLIKDFDGNGLVDEPNRGVETLWRTEDGDIIHRDQVDSGRVEPLIGGIESGTYYLRLEAYHENYFDFDFSPSYPFTSADYEIKFDFSPQPSTASTNPGDSLNTALDLGNLSPGSRQNLTEFVGQADLADIYSFTNTSNAPVEITVQNLLLDAQTGSSRANLELIVDRDGNGLIDEEDGFGFQRGDIVRDRVSIDGSAELSLSTGDFSNWEILYEPDKYYIRIISDGGTGAGVNYELDISVNS